MSAPSPSLMPSMRWRDRPDSPTLWLTLLAGSGALHAVIFVLLLPWIVQVMLTPSTPDVAIAPIEFVPLDTTFAPQASNEPARISPAAEPGPTAIPSPMTITPLPTERTDAPMTINPIPRPSPTPQSLDPTARSAPVGRDPFSSPVAPDRGTTPAPRRDSSSSNRPSSPPNTADRPPSTPRSSSNPEGTDAPATAAARPNPAPPRPTPSATPPTERSTPLPSPLATAPLPAPPMASPLATPVPTPTALPDAVAVNATPAPSRVRAGITVTAAATDRDVPGVNAQPVEQTAIFTMDPVNYSCVIRDNQAWLDMGTPVTMRVEVSETGQATVLQIDPNPASADYNEFARCLLEELWEFTPAMTDGMPQASDNLMVRMILDRG